MPKALKIISKLHSFKLYIFSCTATSVNSLISLGLVEPGIETVVRGCSKKVYKTFDMSKLIFLFFWLLTFSLFLLSGCSGTRCLGSGTCCQGRKRFGIGQQRAHHFGAGHYFHSATGCHSNAASSSALVETWRHSGHRRDASDTAATRISQQFGRTDLGASSQVEVISASPTARYHARVSFHKHFGGG